MNAEPLAALLAAVVEAPRRIAELERNVLDVSKKLDAVLRALPPPLVSVERAAQVLCVSVPTLRRYIKSGRVPSLRIGRGIRVDLSKLEAAGAKEIAHRARQAIAAGPPTGAPRHQPIRIIPSR